MNSKTQEPRWRIKRSALTTIVFATSAGLITFSIFVMFHAGRVALEAQNRMNNQLAVINQLQELASTVKDAETSQRGYLLSGEENYLTLFSNAVPALKSQSEALNKFVSGGEISSEEMDAVSDLIRQKVAELAETIQL